MTYEPTWESLDKRPCPKWFDDAKFGIFIHWGVYSVPAWAPKGRYAEWYWHDMQNKDGATWKFHVRTYGESFRYQDFAPMFKAELFDPTGWADLFVRAGARYVVLTSKHHDGFCLWQSAQSWNWNSVDIGPHRDLIAELTEAVRARGLKMGLYYSLYEWYHPLYLTDVKRYVDEHMLPQLKDVVLRYKPSLIFADGEWEHPSEVWRSTEFLAWLFNESPVRDEVVVNDRWGKETRGRHGGYWTSEYGGHTTATLGPHHKWEENRGIGASFGYNRNEDIDDYATATQLIHLLINVVSNGGNLLLNVGPTADGRIPVIMQQRLIEIGEWLKVNGEAIYETRPWREISDGEFIRYTSKGNDVYAICLRYPEREVVLSAPKPTEETTVMMLGRKELLRWHYSNGKMRIELPPLSVNEL
ncbi:MAG TPA: alpha-L-fucosidase, partial [Armatimonadetes bacterium]|nr:alpha-L-fucosidase [Armatimonadota bacterium]